MSDADQRTWGKALPQLAALLAAFCSGVWTIAKLGYPEFGNPSQCEGIGFGCAPSQEADALGVMMALGFGLVLAVIARRLVPPRLGWHMTSVGILFAAGITGVAWNGAIIRYGVPDITVAEGHAEALRLLDAMRRAVGPAAPFVAERDDHVPALPTPAELVAAINDAPAEPCEDVNGRDTGTSRFNWGISRSVLAPKSTLPPASVGQLEQLRSALATNGYSPLGQRDGPSYWSVHFEKPGPPPRTADYLPVGRFSAALSIGYTDAPSPTEMRVLVGVNIRTPCLREPKSA